MTEPIFWLDWADSEVRAVQREGADLRLGFAAACAWRDDGVARPEAGYLLGLTLRWRGAQAHGAPLGDCIGRLGGARLRVGGGAWSSDARLRLPVNLPAAVAANHPVSLSLSLSMNGTAQPASIEAELSFRNGSVLHLRADALLSQTDGGGALRFIESLAC